MTRNANLPRELVEEILLRAPLTSLKAVRYTCKNWNAFSRNHVIGEAAKTRKQFVGLLMLESKVCSIVFDLQGIRNDDDFVNPSINQLSMLNQVEIAHIIHCDGLLLCVQKDYLTLVVLNLYLGQTRRIKINTSYSTLEEYALGYDSKNHNHKILRILLDFDRRINHRSRLEIYDFNSNSWRTVLDINPQWDISLHGNGVTLKGNSYFDVQVKVTDFTAKHFLLCFNFTTERFGPRLTLPLPLSHVTDIVVVSCVGEEKLAVLYQNNIGTMRIWITTKIEPDEVLWSKFLNLDSILINDLTVWFETASFFINEEKKVAVVCDVGRYERHETSAYIIGQDGYLKSVKIGEAPTREERIKRGYKLCPPAFSSYVPSFVQLDIKQLGKRKEPDY